MINAWSLLYEEMNGTMDKTYPIKNNELSDNENINITTATGDTVYNVPDPDGGINTEKGYIPYDDIDDTITITGGDTIDFNDMPLSFSTFADNDDAIAHHVGLNTANYDTLNIDLSGIEGINLSSAHGEDVITFGEDTKPEPNLDYKSHKYEEDKGIKDLRDYVSSTYNGHYTSKQNNTQTFDLIQSVGDAESFCRSNAIKYLARYDKKGSAKQDILKAMHYCLLLYYFSGNTKEPDYTNTRYETF